jgi:hypothetical protein
MTEEEVQGPTALIRPLWLDSGGLLTGAVPMTMVEMTFILFSVCVFFLLSSSSIRFAWIFSAAIFRPWNNATCGRIDDFKEKREVTRGKSVSSGTPDDDGRIRTEANGNSVGQKVNGAGKLSNQQHPGGGRYGRGNRIRRQSSKSRVKSRDREREKGARGRWMRSEGKRQP